MDWTEAKATALDLLRNAYNREIERLAEELRPRFESGELHATNYEEDGPDSLLDLEKEIETTMVLTCRDAYMVLGSSPSEENVDGSCALAEAKNGAAECVLRDVLLIGLAAGWYSPKPGEWISAAGLALPDPTPMAEVLS